MCIIGAGPCGLTALKALTERGISGDCFEKTDRLGGLWALDTALGKTSAYRSLHINTSREQTQFSDFPMPAHFPDYPDRAQMCAYFEAYARHFGLTRSIVMNTEVRRVRPLGEGGYRVELSTGEARRYDGVIVANGHHSEPYRPALPGEFAGDILHARDYRDPENPIRLVGRRVVVIGAGNSAMDIATELAYSGCEVVLSVRRGAHLLPKWVLGKPVDQTSLLPQWLPRRARRTINRFLLDLIQGDLRAYGWPEPDHRLGDAHPTLSSEIPSLIRNGRVVPKPAITGTAGSRLEFADGSHVSVDAIVMCTGYNVSFPFFEPEFLAAPDNRIPLFFRVHKPGVDNLFFIGLCQTFGAIMPIAEVQGRWVAEQLSGEYELPHRAAMDRAILRQQRFDNHYVRSRRHTIQVDPTAYLEALARERAQGRQRAVRARQTQRPRSTPRSGR